MVQKLKFVLFVSLLIQNAACSGKKDPWTPWSNSPNEAPNQTNSTVETPSDVTPQIVPYNLKLGNWQPLSPQELFKVIPASSPRSGVSTPHGFVYSSARATVLIPKSGEAKLLNGDYWKLIGKLPDGSVIAETDNQILHRLDIATGQFSTFLDLTTVIPNVYMSSDVISTPSGILLSLNDASTFKSGVYLVKGDGTLSEVILENSSWTSFSLSHIYGSDKYALIKNYITGMNYIYSADDKSVREIPTNSSDITIASHSANGETWYIDSNSNLLRGYADGRFDTYLIENESMKEFIQYPELFLAGPNNLYVISSNNLYQITIQGNTFKVVQSSALLENQYVATINGLSAVYDPFYLSSNGAFYLALTGDEDSETPLHGILEIKPDGTMQILTAEFDLNAVRNFIRISQSEVMGIIEDDEANFSLLIQMKPGETKEIFRPDTITNNLINHGLEFAAPIEDSDTWVLGTHDSLMKYDTKSEFLKQVHTPLDLDVYKRNWIWYKNGYAYSLDHILENSPKMAVTIWDVSDDEIKSVATHYFDAPAYSQLAQSRVESSFVNGNVEMTHLWLKLSNYDTGGSITYDIFLDLDKETNKLLVRPLPASSLSDMTFGSSFARTPQNESWELTNDGLFKETIPATYERVQFTTLSTFDKIVDIATSEDVLVISVVDTTTRMSSLLVKVGDKWRQLQRTTWVHSDLWLTPEGNIQWKVIDPTDSRISKLLFMNSQMEEITEYPWNPGCAADAQTISNLATFGTTTDYIEGTDGNCIFK